jgi:23S rRNA (cytosine1962-C5)-methyltransferase
MTAMLPVLRLLPGRHKRLRAGHPWAYSNEIAMDTAAKALPRGGLVRLEASHGEALGVASFNPHALIAARLFANEPDATIDEKFFATRIEAALALRETLYPGGFYRLVHAEADRLPGLIVDRYGDVLSVQLNTAGADRLHEPILAALKRCLGSSQVVLRNDSSARALEGLPAAVETEALSDRIQLGENGARFLADLAAGQKTGWFYDQRDNRALVARLAHGARVLDAYCYAGGFGVLAALRGANEVMLLDRSEGALALAAAAAEINGVASRCRMERGEVFEALLHLGQSKERFDIVIADPPSFVKSRKDLGPGSRGYRKLARLASALVVPRGFLFIASCSHNVEPPLFAELVARGIDDAGRTGRIIASVGAAADHPVHPFLPESAYLKGQLLQLD